MMAVGVTSDIQSQLEQIVKHSPISITPLKHFVKPNKGSYETYQTPTGCPFDCCRKHLEQRYFGNCDITNTAVQMKIGMEHKALAMAALTGKVPTSSSVYQGTVSDPMRFEELMNKSGGGGGGTAEIRVLDRNQILQRTTSNNYHLHPQQRMLGVDINNPNDPTYSDGYKIPVIQTSLSNRDKERHKYPQQTQVIKQTPQVHPNKPVVTPSSSSSSSVLTSLSLKSKTSFKPQPTTHHPPVYHPPHQGHPWSAEHFQRYWEYQQQQAKYLAMAHNTTTQSHVINKGPSTTSSSSSSGLPRVDIISSPSTTNTNSQLPMMPKPMEAHRSSANPYPHPESYQVRNYNNQQQQQYYYNQQQMNNTKVNKTPAHHHQTYYHSTQQSSQRRPQSAAPQHYSSTPSSSSWNSNIGEMEIIRYKMNPETNKAPPPPDENSSIAMRLLKEPVLPVPPPNTPSEQQMTFYAAKSIINQHHQDQQKKGPNSKGVVGVVVDPKPTDLSRRRSDNDDGMIHKHRMMAKSPLVQLPQRSSSAGDAKSNNHDYDHVVLLDKRVMTYMCKRCLEPLKSDQDIRNHLFCKMLQNSVQCHVCRDIIPTEQYTQHLKIHGMRPISN